MYRLLFEKKGRAVWMSHLDLMRLFQRAFKRAGFSLTHTQGFNPRPSVSIALPMSVGIESSCELLDFTLDDNVVSTDEIRNRLNEALVEGVNVLSVYSDGRKIRDIAYLQCKLELQYDDAVALSFISAMENLFSSDEVIVEKKSKNGIQPVNIIPMIRSVNISEDSNNITIMVKVCCQNPSLNPMLIISAIERYLPDCYPSFCKCTRTEIFDVNDEVFR